MTLQLPPDTPASAARRSEIYGAWESEGSLAQKLPHLKALTNDGRMLAVWVHEEGEHRYPRFQFDREGQLIPQMKPLLHLLRGPNGLTDEPSPSGWLEVEWLYAPHVQLDGKLPADCFPTDPERVLAAAVEEFAQGIDSRW